MKRILALCAFIMIVIGPALWAEAPRLLVVHAAGQGFEIVRNGKSEYVDLKAKKAVGYEIKVGDSLNVDARSTVECQLFPLPTVLRASASTSFTLRAVHDTGALDLDVAYGRLRTKTDERQSGGKFHYSGLDIAAAGVGADFGFDQLFTSGKELAPVVYCLGGALEISRAAGKAVSLAPQYMATLGGADEFVTAGIGADLRNLWAKNDFTTRPSRVVPSPEPLETVLADADTTEPVPPDNKDETPEKEVTPEPEPKKETIPDPVVKTPETKKAAEPLLIDNLENALGVREKLTAVGEKDMFVNPDFNKEKEKAAAAAPPPSEPAKEEKKEEPKKETTATAEAQPAPAPAPQPAPPAAPLVGFTMDIGVEGHYLYSYDPINLIDIPGLEWITDFLEFLTMLRLGVTVDADLMFWGIIGVGVEGGIFYNEITTQDSLFAPVFVHFITIPIRGVIRFTLGPLFIQPHFGMVFAGVIAGGTALFADPAYEFGGKLGLRLGNMTIFGTVTVMAPSPEDLFASTSFLSFGAGILFKVF